MKKVKRFFPLFLILVLTPMLLMYCSKTEKNDMEKQLQEFIARYEAKVIPLSKEANLAYFEATTTGKDELYKKYEQLQLELDKIHANKQDFARLKEFRASGAIKDSLLKRQLDILYNLYLEKQIDEQKLEQMVKMQTDLEKEYSKFRATIDGKEYTDNQIEEILKTETDSRKLQKAWEASKQVGAAVALKVLKLVALRNEAARELGFPNYHTMQLELGEQNPEQIEQLFDELDELTRDTFRQLKQEIDAYLAKRYGIPQNKLMPWHYQNRYFQEAPKIYKVDLDKYYANQDIVELTRKYYASIGLPIDDLLQKSDLFERKGKYQHAYCTDIDRNGDVRVVANVKPNYNWMNTMLHEFGHAVYDRYHDMHLPWLLREPAHTFTTEAIAMMFGRFASNPAWMRDMGVISPDEARKISADCWNSLRLEQLVFSRWAQVMYRFEKSMYENPNQDLNKLWWDLKEKYQFLHRPPHRNAPDWAAKIHVALYPAYYHNYLMGELLASQLYYYIGQNILHAQDLKDVSYVNHPEVGQYLQEKIFKPGKRYYWNNMIERATGEKLTAKYYAKQFVK